MSVKDKKQEAIDGIVAAIVGRLSLEDGISLRRLMLLLLTDEEQEELNTPSFLLREKLLELPERKILAIGEIIFAEGICIDTVMEQSNEL